MVRFTSWLLYPQEKASVITKNGGKVLVTPKDGLEN